LPNHPRQLAPGLISAAADNDPTTVATMAVAGAAGLLASSFIAVPVLVATCAAAVCRQFVAGGLATPVGLVFLLLIARKPEAVGTVPVGPRLTAPGWATTAVVTAAGLAFVVVQVRWQ
jgi:Mn2+/Fe2+ NRAMP family transporter